jgi:hypothetical protein
MVLYEAESETQLHFGEMGTDFQAVHPYETVRYGAATGGGLSGAIPL